MSIPPSSPNVALVSPSQKSLGIAMVAGEASGDLLAGLLLDGMNAQWPQLQAVGIGGPLMARRGFSAWWSHEKLAVHGFSWELIRRYREIVGIRNQLKARLLASPPRVFIGVDAPDFNLDLESELKGAGIKTVHFVCPSIWAWRPKRVEKIRRSVDHVLCIFPFEPALLAQHGIKATYVGHPLANHIPMRANRDEARKTLGFAATDTVVAILPGSRRSEVEHLALRFFMAAALIQKAQPAIRFVVPVAPLLRDAIEQAAKACGMADQVKLVDGQSHTVLAACDVTLIASGTATLEAALFKRPMVIAYHMSWLSWQLMKRKRLQPWVGLPNILCRDFVVPEYLQNAATPQALASAVLGWLQSSPGTTRRLQALDQKFTELHTELRRDTSLLAAHAIQEVLQS